MLHPLPEDECGGWLQQDLVSSSGSCLRSWCLLSLLTLTAVHVLLPLLLRLPRPFSCSLPSQVRHSLSPRTVHDRDDPPSAEERLEAMHNAAARAAAEEADAAKSKDAWLDGAPAALRRKLEQLEVDRREYPDRDTHESWVRFYVGKGDFLTADSVVEQMLQLQTDAAGGNGGGGSGGGGGGSSGGAAVATIAEPEPNAEDRSWMEQGFQEMVQEEQEQKG